MFFCFGFFGQKNFLVQKCPSSESAIKKHLSYLHCNIFFCCNWVFQRTSFREHQLPNFKTFSYSQLYYGKWVLTFIFCVLYFIPTFLIVRKYFPSKIFSQITIYSHIIVFCLGGFFYLLGLITSDMERWYDFSRNFLGFLQSPWMLIILFPSFLIL